MSSCKRTCLFPALDTASYARIISMNVIDLIDSVLISWRAITFCPSSRHEHDRFAPVHCQERLGRSIMMVLSQANKDLIN